MLTDLKVRKAQPNGTDYKLGDTGGLYLFVTKAGAKSSRFKYRFGGKEKRIVLGRYPEVSLAEARERRGDARKLLREHRDPAVEAQKRRLLAAASAQATFEKVAREWHEMQTPRWVPIHVADVLKSLETGKIPCNRGSELLRRLCAKHGGFSARSLHPLADVAATHAGGHNLLLVRA